MDRFGLRRTMLAALTLVAFGVALTPLMTEPWQLILLWGVVVGSGSGVTALVLGATVAAPASGGISRLSRAAARPGAAHR
jgi:MFS family permease